MTDAATAARAGLSFPNESAAYREARDALLAAEADLRRRTEAVAVMRRALPAGGAAREDYVFEEGDDARKVRLSELFGRHDTLVAYCYMYGPNMDEPCPSCSSMLDSLDGDVAPISQNVSLAIIARSPIQRILAFARERGWRNLRLLSSANNSFHPDYFGETPAGQQRPMLNVFTRNGGVIHHAYGTELAYAPGDPGQDPRHIDIIWPLWGVLDFTPGGRGDFRPSLRYG
jgi:predicted dithiol-disulfide oxidoreductase (DUF899 family)